MANGARRSLKDLFCWDWDDIIAIKNHLPMGKLAKWGLATPARTPAKSTDVQRHFWLVKGFLSLLQRCHFNCAGLFIQLTVIGRKLEANMLAAHTGSWRQIFREDRCKPSLLGISVFNISQDTVCEIRAFSDLSGLR